MLQKILFVSCLMVGLLNNASAGLIQWDAFSMGDDLAVKDESTGLVWLDLTVTAGQDFNAVSSLYNGWELAEFTHVEELLDSIFPDIVFSGPLGEPNSFEENCVNTSACFSSASEWQNLFGYIEGTPSYQTYSYGLYRDAEQVLRMGGSFKNGSGSANRYGSQFSVDYGVNYRQAFDNGHFNNFSTFLIQTSSLSKPTNISALTSKVDAALVKVNTPSSSIFAFIALLWLTSSSIIRRPEYRASN